MNDFTPAFPTTECVNGTTWHYPGATLRDYFAAKAMQSLLTTGTVALHNIPQRAYEYADAMLKARGES